MPILLRGIEGIKAYSGFNLGKSSWLEVNQEMINLFGAAIDDRDWIDLDQETTREKSLGGVSAPNYLIVSLMIPMLDDIYLLEDTGRGMHCGINRLRFLAPVPVNSSIQLDATLKSVEVMGAEGQLVLECVVECDALKEPVLQAEIVYRFCPSSHARVSPVNLCEGS
ncbi:MaoC/PaaZ C-terminal domain-containing protein [Paraburkholderia strydomiana]|uniref:MaoC/PaaZ C-terminal domain-containing protein n=1 Tax=Paraburkholderia strydomiana TaxID=1245417 RepID=UPI001BE99277|nr:MaoC/PaaZ C-terminal domain-containing protein [Paraburkholderia strydomiana]MBT2793531.1 acyl dehydratase [Paraburkholderia strydomiana]